jgi:hypothetical protein
MFLQTTIALKDEDLKKFKICYNKRKIKEQHGLDTVFYFFRRGFWTVHME